MNKDFVYCLLSFSFRPSFTRDGCLSFFKLISLSCMTSVVSPTTTITTASLKRANKRKRPIVFELSNNNNNRQAIAAASDKRRDTIKQLLIRQPQEVLRHGNWFFPWVHYPVRLPGQLTLYTHAVRRLDTLRDELIQNNCRYLKTSTWKETAPVR